MSSLYSSDGSGCVGCGCVIAPLIVMAVGEIAYAFFNVPLKQIIGAGVAFIALMALIGLAIDVIDKIT